jgi:hypothetical protein
MSREPRATERFMKFALIGLVLLAVVGYGGTKWYLHHKVSSGVDVAVMVATPHASIEYGGISSTLSGELTIDDVRIQVKGFRDDIEIGRLGIKTPNFLALLKLSDLSAGAQAAASPPEYFGFIAEGIRVSARDDYLRHIYDENIKKIAPSDIRQGGVQCVGKYGFSPKTLEALGYGELVMSSSIILRQDEANFIIETEFNVEDMIDLEMDAAIVGDVMSGVAMGARYRPTLHSLQMTFEDRSLNGRIEKYCTELGLTPEQILRAHLDSLRYFGKQNGIEFDRYVIDPYMDYLAGKSTLIVTARPREPIQLARISKYKPSDVPALLNLEAAAQ